MYVALDLSKYIISKCVRDGHPISNLQLQKILYYIQVYFLKQKPFGYYHNNFYYLKLYYRLLYMQNTDLSDHLLERV